MYELNYYYLGRSENAEPYVHRFLGCSLVIFLKVRSMWQLYKLRCSSQLSYLRDLLIFGHSARSKQYEVPRRYREVGKQTFFVQGIVDWNLVPTKVRLFSSLNAFRERCTGVQ